MSPLPAWDPPLGPHPQFAIPKEETLQMKEKVFSLTGDDFHVKTVDGHEVCKCKGKVFSIHDAKVFSDMQDNPIFSLRNKLLAINKSFNGEDANGKNVFEIKGHFSLLSSKSTCTFHNGSDGRQMELEIKGDWFDRSATITCGGSAVAQIKRSFMNYRQIFGDKQTYFVTVAPGVDLSLIAAICVALDERENEK